MDMTLASISDIDAHLIKASEEGLDQGEVNADHQPGWSDEDVANGHKEWLEA